LSSLLPLDLDALPSGPTRTVLDAGVPVVVWAVTGSAHIATAASHLTLLAGEALWLPGDERATVRGTEGGCILPIRAHNADPAAGPAHPFTVPLTSTGRRLLLSLFTRSLGLLHGDGVPASTLLQALNQPIIDLAPPRMPRSSELRRVAEALLTDPAATLTRVAGDHGLSESAVTRGFRSETGWTPTRWRARRTLAAAAEQVRRTGRVSAGLAATAYTTPQAFARAFRREWGFPPSRLLDPAPTPRANVPVGTDALGPQRNGYHVVCWVAAGGAELTIDEETVLLTAGDIVCLPAGRSVKYCTQEGSAVIPLGWLPGGLPMAGGIIARVDESATAPLLRLAAWAYTEVTPYDGGDARRALEAALGLQEAPATHSDVTRATYALLDELSHEPSNDASTEQLAARMGIEPADLRGAIDALTGTNLPSWRSRMRMAWARRLLREGAHATQVARRLGYADSASFSRAFTRAHGCPPATYRKRAFITRGE
jgi:AraC-like DNA-binding protein